jgi:hypothetical protein
MEDFRLAAQNVNVTWNYTLCIAVEAEGVPSDVLYLGQPTDIVTKKKGDVA